MDPPVFVMNARVTRNPTNEEISLYIDKSDMVEEQNRTRRSVLQIS